MAVTLKTNALITTTELIAFIGDTPSGTDYQNTIINFASDFIEKFCNRKFIAATYTLEIYSGNGRQKLYVKNGPLNTVTTVQAWDTYNNSASESYTVYQDYLLDLEYGFIFMRSGWTKGFQNFRVTYNGGWAIADIPYDLKKACADLAQWMYSMKDKVGIGAERIGSYSVTYNSGNAAFNGITLPAEIT